MSISYLFISVLYLITYSYIYTLERFHVAQGSLETNTHQGPDLAGSLGASQDSKLHMHRAELEVEPVEVAVQPQSPEATESSDYSSDASFVTAVEDSLQPRRPGGICELMASLSFRPFGLWAIALDLSHLSPEDTTCGGCRKPRLALGIAQNWQRR